MRKPGGFNRSTHGFSLITMSIVLTVAAVIFASILPGQDAGDYNKKTITNVQKLERVEEAMRAFMAFNGRRPCPADGQYALNTANFGLEAAMPGTCTGGTPAAPLGPDAGTSEIVGGVIPVRSLGLPDDYAFDEFGHRFTYVVDKRATSLAICQTLEGISLSTFTATGKGGLVIQNTANSGTVIDQTMYAYISDGASGYGAWPQQVPTAGGAPANRINSGSTDGDMQTNAGVDAHFPNGASAFTYNTTNFTHAKVQKDRVAPTSSDTGFDDLVWYRGDIKNTCCLGSICIPTGFRVDEPAGSGTAASGAVAVGDVNGDGYADLIIGSFAARPSGVQQMGQLYVLFGSKTGISGPFELSGLNGTNGFSINITTNTALNFGYSVAAADLNGDGYSDIIVGAPAASYGAAGSGSVYVIFGGPNAVAGGDWLPGAASVVNIANLNGYTGVNGTSGFRMDDTTASEEAGMGVAAGDVLNTGHKGIIISTGTSGVAGPWYVVGGKASWTHATYTLDSVVGTNGLIDGTQGFKISGVTGNNGHPNPFVVASGDINGDHIDDAILTTNNSSANTTWVIFGGAPPWPNPVTLGSLAGNTGVNGTAGFKFNAGGSVATGDINGDGIADLVIGDYGTGAYVIYGSTSSTWGSGSVTAASLTGTANGFLINGISSALSPACGNDVGGATVAVGDLNHDGIGDIILGNWAASAASYNTAGAVYVVYGQNTWPASTSIANLNGSNGFALIGSIAGGEAGGGEAVGNFTGGSYPSLAIYSPCTFINGDGGSVYLLYGRSGARPSSYSLGNLP